MTLLEYSNFNMYLQMISKGNKINTNQNGGLL